MRRSTRVSSIGTTPPPKRRKVVHPHKTKVFKSTTAEKQPTQNVYTPDLPTSQADNVSNVPVNSDFQKVIFENSQLEGLKQYLKGYVSITIIYFFVIILHVL